MSQLISAQSRLNLGSIFELNLGSISRRQRFRIACSVRLGSRSLIFAQRWPNSRTQLVMTASSLFVQLIRFSSAPFARLGGRAAACAHTHNPRRLTAVGEVCCGGGVPGAHGGHGADGAVCPCSSSSPSPPPSPLLLPSSSPSLSSSPLLLLLSASPPSPYPPSHPPCIRCGGEFPDGSTNPMLQPATN